MGRDTLNRRVSPLVPLIAGVVLVLDQLSKALVRSALGSGDPLTVVPYVGRSVVLVPDILSLTYVRNAGGAWGLFPGKQWAFITVSLTVVATILFVWWRVRPEGRIVALSLGLVAGGALGNLVDRVVIGSVTDFLDFKVWPVFNIADSCIVVGTSALVVLTLLVRERDGADKVAGD